MIISNFGNRTGHTPEQKDNMPDNLEDKTGKLEKRLLLRQFITKALEIKRIEVAELTRRGDVEHAAPGPFPSLIQNSPQN